jgi:hypothetical protein
MNRSSVPRQQQQKHQQQQKLLRIKKQEKTLEFHSRLIEALVRQTPPHLHLGECLRAGLSERPELFAWSSASPLMELGARHQG